MEYTRLRQFSLSFPQLRNLVNISREKKNGRSKYHWKYVREKKIGLRTAQTENYIIFSSRCHF